MKLTTLFTLPFLITPLLAIPANSGQGGRNRPKPTKPKPIDTKYFHEPGGNDELGHYDIRYYKDVVNYEERGDTLRNLVRSYLTVFREKNIETWIAHGTLLGWWWNGKIMPWDYDLDAQISAATLFWMSENLNMTFHDYTFIDSEGKESSRQYLLDVNPNHVDRQRGDGMNVIDARWIDTVNGLYIDITGLAETNPERQPGVWSCKNYHHYRTRDIYPLRETEFEGVKALVPYGFDTILVQEYSPRALTKTLHEGHTWNPSQKEWIKNPPQTNLNPNSNTNTQSPGHGGVARSHVPRGLLVDSSSSSFFGLGNLLNAL